MLKSLNKPKARRKIEIVSLIDMIFILLIFFIALSSLIEPNPSKFLRSFNIPAPKDELGSPTQLMIQVLDNGQYFILNESAFRRIRSLLGRPPESIMRRLIQEFTVDRDGLDLRLESIFNRARMDNRKYFITIRIPDEAIYGNVVALVNHIAGHINVSYCIVGGSIDQLESGIRISRPRQITLADGSTQTVCQIDLLK